jgi:ABC-2 type transport system permease protein
MSTSETPVPGIVTSERAGVHAASATPGPELSMRPGVAGPIRDTGPNDGRMPGRPYTGLGTLYLRRLRVTTKTVDGIIGQFLTPVLWVLIVAPALAAALGTFNPGIDYYTYLAVGQAAFIVPFTAMFNGINVIVDKQFGITRELLAAPVRRPVITLANALAVLTIAVSQVVVILALAGLRGAEFSMSTMGAMWFLAAVGLLTLGVYGIAETLALRIGRQEAYGPLIPAIGVTPWFLAGALFPISVLPTGVEHATLFSPWTHAVAVMHHGMMGEGGAGLVEIWGLQSTAGMAALSVAALGMFAAFTLRIAIRTFQRTAT